MTSSWKRPSRSLWFITEIWVSYCSNASCHPFPLKKSITFKMLTCFSFSLFNIWHIKSNLWTSTKRKYISCREILRIRINHSRLQSWSGELMTAETLLLCFLLFLRRCSCQPKSDLIELFLNQEDNIVSVKTILYYSSSNRN